MSRWWLLSLALALWLMCGYLLIGPGTVDAGAGTPSSRPPARIVSMAPNLTEILFALGLGEQMVGVTQDSDYPAAAQRKPRVGTFWQPNIEAIIAAKPDLVVTLAFQQQSELARRLKRIGYNALTIDIETLDDLFNGVALIGNAVSARAQARDLTWRIKTRIDRVRKVTADLPRVKVLWVVQREPLRIASRDTFINEMIELAGGENAVGPALRNYPPIGAEQVITAGPKVIIEPIMVPGAPDEQLRQALAYWRRFTNVPAVVEQRIYVIDGDLVSRLGPRLPEGVEIIARCLRPALFGTRTSEVTRSETLGD